ncbi:MAG: hypothetical protein UT39_C0006G0013 [Candidatus Woesebacteria bacterium GW2011_GWA1_39_21]|uniref:Methyltransferase type 11 domain-containing protein n=1 Tax=Candidatus Woesebacteria bacterium GW2011_GWA1_39_21 TaxID=1618550 RepID=A0A0G0RCT1_9BACT|nr:MAG: hypothetical protein UT39_C0006G0013 [Candidatus Woesebacteria bacterium GW2011_GWA1_39_21]
MKDELKEETLKKLLQKFWYIPSDVVLRTYEALLWNKIKFIHPNLDVGCGDGEVDDFLFKGKYFDCAIDVIESDIPKARKLSIYKKVIKADARALPFKNNSFSQVISNSSFEHIQNDAKAISEISRVLKKGGFFCFTTTNNFLKKELKKITASDERFISYNERVKHFHYRSLQSWKKILFKNGLKIRKHYLYMDEDTVKVWFLLFRMFTFKIKKRELWSYLSSSKITKFIPSSIVAKVELFVLKKVVRFEFSQTQGHWLYIEAVKTI